MLIAAAFCMFNRYVDGLGTFAPANREDYVPMAERIVEFDSMEVVLVRDPTDPQAVPRFGIHATGPRGGAPVDTVYVLEDVGGTWLLTGERDATSA